MASPSHACFSLTPEADGPLEPLGLLTHLSTEILHQLMDWKEEMHTRTRKAFCGWTEMKTEGVLLHKHKARGWQELKERKRQLQRHPPSAGDCRRTTDPGGLSPSPGSRLSFQMLPRRAISGQEKKQTFTKSGDVLVNFHVEPTRGQVFVLKY